MKNVKILGTGCKKCNKLEYNVKEAINLADADAQVEHITEYGEIAKYGVMLTPALVIDGNVVAAGKVLKPKEIAELL